MNKNALKRHMTMILVLGARHVLALLSRVPEWSNGVLEVGEELAKGNEPEELATGNAMVQIKEGGAKV